MNEHERIKQYNETGSRGLSEYVFVFLDYQTGFIVRKYTKSFSTNKESYDAAQIAVEAEESRGRILMLYQYYPKSDVVEESFHMLHGMFWPEAVKEAVQTYFEVL